MSIVFCDAVRAPAAEDALPERDDNSDGEMKPNRFE